MTAVREDDLAWNLVENFRDCLDPAQLTTAYVDLGVGDYSRVIHAVLHAAAQTGKSLSAETAAKVQAWRDCYHQHLPETIDESREFT